jgi:hypothetical protein
MKIKPPRNSVAVVLSVLLFSSLALAQAAVRAERNQTATKASAPHAQNKAASASGCALLPISVLEKAVGQRFQSDPTESKAPPAYDGAWGSSCKFVSKPPFTNGQQTSIDLLIYTESSAAEAKQTFDKAAVFFMDSSKPKPSGIGDSAYWDNIDGDNPKIHVLKGRVHYSLGVDPANEKLTLQLASALAARL